MKTQVFGNLKKKTIDLRSSVVNTKKQLNIEEVEYKILSDNNRINKIVIDNNYVSFVTNEGINSIEYEDIYRLKSIIHNYIRKSILNGSICGCYKVYVNRNGEHRNIMTFNNEKYFVSDTIGVIVCSNDLIETILKNEFIDTFGFSSSLDFRKPRVRIIQ